jgi:hypothetical protein
MTMGNETLEGLEGRQEFPAVIVSGIGSEEHLSRLDPLARRLAAALELPLHPLPDPLDPITSLTALAAAPPGWVSVLPTDPGRPLPSGGCWVEALGAWRLPTLLVFSEDQLATGLPAALTALARQWRVPLLGLLQWGGAWQPQIRRRDGLPWIGAVGAASGGEEEDEEAAAFSAALLVLRRRWRQLDPTPGG